MSGFGPGSWSELFTGLASGLWKELLKVIITPKDGVGVVYELGSGYSADEEKADRARRLYALCEEATSNPAWFQRDDGTTCCNRAAAFIAQGMGYFGFRHGASANEMIANLEADPTWRADSLERATRHAMRGGLAFLTMKDEPHCHICAVAPLEMEDSGSWGGPVPMTANIGPKASHGIIRASYAFKAADRDRVKAFVYMGDIA